MNGYLLLEDQADNTVMIGKNPITANTAINPTSKSATTHGILSNSSPPGATGIKATNAAAAPTNNNGATQKIGLSALSGIIISFETNFIPSAIN